MPVVQRRGGGAPRTFVLQRQSGSQMRLHESAGQRRFVALPWYTAGVGDTVAGMASVQTHQGSPRGADGLSPCRS